MAAEANSECRTIGRYAGAPAFLSSEATCIFPFYFEGKLNEGCNILDEGGLLIRVFYCPIYHTVNKINGIDSYTFSDLQQQVSH